MLVDNSLPSHLAADFSDFINTDLFATSYTASSSPSDNDSSPPESPFQGLLTTPPQDLPPAAFPDFDASSFASTSAGGPSFSFLDDDPLKSFDPSSFSFLSLPGMQAIDPSNMHLPMSMPMDFSSDMNMSGGIPIRGPSATDMVNYLSIDPSLVGTPAPSVSTSELETVDEEPSDDAPESSSSQNQRQAPKQDEQRERLTLTITPAKVGGHGKSRKGTVQGGGISKRNPQVSSSHSNRDKENSGLLSTTSTQSPVVIAVNAAALKKAKARAVSEAPSSADGDDFSASAADMARGYPMSPMDKDDLAIDWRPPPEILSKMSSKEKRQLRNKISARNFRVRRKEYISTLEGDIADRDRLLDAIRTELGSTQSENLALRQEIVALKKILLEGRGAEALASLNLPPPAPLALPLTNPAIGSTSGSSAVSASALAETSTSASAAIVIDPALTSHSSATNASVSLSLPTPTASPQSSSLNLLTPNTQKDLPTSPRLGAHAFWGGATRPSFGMGMGGGVTPVHTVLIPDLSASFGAGVSEDINSTEKGETRALQENMNPALNSGILSKNVNASSSFGLGSNIGGFEGWADTNPLTMKTLDAYRMHLWSKMAAQQQFQRSQQAQNHRPSATPPLTGLASHMRPHYFTSSSSASSLYPSPPSTPPQQHYTPHHNLPTGSTLSALLSGKNSVLSSSSGLSGFPGPSTPPGSPHLRGLSEPECCKGREKEREQREYAALAAIAGQTLFKKLGSAFWDAFSGHTAPTTAIGSSSGKAGKDWDVDKVRKVLEGKAVVRIVDVEPEKIPSPACSVLTAGMAAMCVEDKKANEKKSKCNMTDLLEESMRSLTVSKKV